MREHFQLILDGIQVGLEERAEVDLPMILTGLMPPTAVRAIVTIDEKPYEVVVREARSGYGPSPQHRDDPDCHASTHGKHTPVAGRCIGCGETVS